MVAAQTLHSGPMKQPYRRGPEWRVCAKQSWSLCITLKVPNSNVLDCLYRVGRVVTDLGWVDLDLDVLSPCPAAQTLLLIPKPKQKSAGSVMKKFSEPPATTSPTL